ncbi:MAG: response regulator [Cyanosarcina radialis HA8281-LM2]|jgi:chemotaxis protein histidine kinase CheA|nr:response regulator [Cyanosarcina radialis HA8281-LM2]
MSAYQDSPDIDLVEAQLQQELRQMFEVDTQMYLQNYIELAQRLQPQSWTADIQEMYRAIHTIKGGAVTVAADAILLVATALEDLLSDLRYLDPAPPLADGQLGQKLLEAGELLASSLEVKTRGNMALVAVQPSVRRLETLRSQIQQLYLPEWNEQQLLHQEFAEQGFDLVVLDLEMALEELPPDGEVPLEIFETAKRTTGQLEQIGRDIELAEGWQQLLNRTQEFCQHRDVEFWHSQLPSYLQQLKDCAKNGGKLASSPASAAAGSSETQLDLAAEPAVEQMALGAEEDLSLSTSHDSQPVLEVEPELTFDLDTIEALSAINESLLAVEFTEDATISEPDLTESWLDPEMTIIEGADLPLSVVASEESQPAIEERENEVQIPVPLGRLDQTSQNLVETLLAARASQSFSNELQSQLVKLVALAKESVQYITRLRQIQDDYALLDSFNRKNPQLSDNPTVERYRQGYLTINRLLESSLRLSELGAEAEKSALQTTESLQRLDRNILKLQNTVEESRLVPFKNLSFRARAIIRDLSNRYNKPARLIVQGENIELDAGTISKLEPALLHLLRNAYDHGLESYPERFALGKPEIGTITLTLRRRGNSYLLDVRDDGRGIDAAKIHQSAVSKNLPLTSTNTPAELLGVLCQSGFSSRDTVSEISGRGVGMDVVANQIADLGGRMSLDTVPEQGATFHLQFPVPHLLVSCVLLKVGDRSVAIPAEDISITGLLSNLKATPANGSNSLCSWTIEAEDRSLPGMDLSDYWYLGPRTNPLSETAICIKVRSWNTQQEMWFLADELLGQTELLIESLPSPLVPPTGLMGLSLQPDGSLIPVVEATILAEYLLTSPTASSIPAAMPMTTAAVAEAPQPLPAVDEPEAKERGQSSQTILVVDDAALMRRRLESSLNTYGYATHTCADGQEAWNWLQNNPLPALMLTDIEMPVMDGFTLIDRCRQAGIDIPILVISSRIAEEWSKEAKRLGATDYLTKGFSTADLLVKVKSLLVD